jgi:hypothetical protein
MATYLITMVLTTDGAPAEWSQHDPTEKGDLALNHALSEAAKSHGFVASYTELCPTDEPSLQLHLKFAEKSAYDRMFG